MFITIRQTQASKKNLFQVEGEAGILFRARTPWASIQAPFQAENLRQLTFTDAQGNTLFHTDYNILENTMQAVSRYKYLFGTATKLMEYQVLDNDGRSLGSFYTQIDGAFTSQMTIDYQEQTYACYDRALGKIYVISVFDGERQIAQISKSLDVWDRLDIFYLYLDDAYQDMLPILSFFTIYVDAQKFNRPGHIAGRSVEKSWSYSFNRNNDKYDPDWVRETFGQEAARQLEDLLAARPKRRDADAEQPRKRRRLVIAILAVMVLVILIAVAAQLLLSSKTALLPEEFAEMMRGYGYTVAESAPSEIIDGWELAYAAEMAERSIWYLSFSSAESAERFFNQAKDQYAPETNDMHTEISINSGQNQKYTLLADGRCLVISRIGATVVLGIAPDTDKEQIQDILKELGY